MLKNCEPRILGDQPAAGGTIQFVSGSVDVYADLPTPVANYAGQFWFVRNGSGGLLSILNSYKYPSGTHTYLFKNETATYC